MLKYQEVVAKLKEYIDYKGLKQGDRLPILSDLIDKYRVSRNTVIRALDVLESEGRIYQVRGSGIYIRSHYRDGYFNVIDEHGFYDDYDDSQLGSDVLSVERVPAPDAAARQLMIEAGEEVYGVHRVRLIADEPFAVERSYYRTNVIPHLSEHIVAKSIGYYLTQELGLKIGFSDLTWEIEALTTEEAGLLHRPEAEPCAHLTSTVFLHNGEPLSYARITYPKDSAKFFLQTHPQ